VHSVVVTPVLKVLSESTPDLKPSSAANSDVTEVKQPVNVGSQ